MDDFTGVRVVEGVELKSLDAQFRDELKLPEHLKCWCIRWMKNRLLTSAFVRGW